ncbi:MAG: hypothetical protein K6T83_20090 [Alicyclobacillus sp.]|nr:hypothetical protein [Alicyclobacillus sp.]
MMRAAVIQERRPGGSGGGTDRTDPEECREQVEACLLTDPGEIVIVSHDRYLISRLTNRVMTIVDGRVEKYSGTYDEWEGFPSLDELPHRCGKPHSQVGVSVGPVDRQSEPGARAVRTRRSGSPNPALGQSTRKMQGVDAAPTELDIERQIQMLQAELTALRSSVHR